MFNLSVDEATTIELIPSPASADVSERLAATTHQAEALRASIAFWTVGPGYVGTDLASRLKQTTGFLCTDIHLPTNIDQLDALVAQGAHVRLHLKQLVGNTETFLAPAMPPHLLHTKMLLFDLPQGEAELWVGSHNWTKRALEGPNVEASLVLRIKQNSPLYDDARRMLTYIHDLCTPFDRKRVDYYKQLQQNTRDEPLARVVECEGKHIDQLENTGIIVFSDFEEDINDLPIGTLVYLLAIDSDHPSNPRAVYRTRVIQTGALPAANLSAANVRFDGHRYILRRERRLPVLELPLQRAQSMERVEYFATLDIKEHVPRAVVIDSLPKKSFWQMADQDPLLVRTRAVEMLRQETVEHRAQRERDLRRIKIKVPRTDVGTVVYTETLDQKRLSVNRSLVSRKIVRIEASDG